jgi:predicted esterase
MNQNKLRVSRTAHYYTHGSLSKSTAHIWFVFHGYGQQADQVLSKFEDIDEQTHFLIAPEGLSKFYWHKNNVPVASWMTKRDRYDEINDFVQFLDQLYDLYCRHLDHQVKIHLFGFSQGCATMWRWIHASQIRFNTLINWAGWVPEDISYLHLIDYLKDKKMFSHVGDSDEFMTEDVLNKLGRLLNDNQLNMITSKFNGTHRIPKEELMRYLSEDAAILS